MVGILRHLKCEWLISSDVREVIGTVSECVLDIKTATFFASVVDFQSIALDICEPWQATRWRSDSVGTRDQGGTVGHIRVAQSALHTWIRYKGRGWLLWRRSESTELSTSDVVGAFHEDDPLVEIFELNHMLLFRSG